MMSTQKRLIGWTFLLTSILIAQPAVFAESGISFRAALFSPSATDSFDEVYGSGGFFIGAGFTSLLARESIAVDFALDVMVKEGERVSLVGDHFEKSGHSQTLYYMPLTVTGRYRFRPGTSMVPYVGGGLGLYYISEEVDDSNVQTQDSDEINFGAHLCGGIELLADRAFTFSLEARYFTLPDSLGNEDTVSGYYDETDAGGLALGIVGTLYLGR